MPHSERQNIPAHNAPSLSDLAAPARTDELPRKGKIKPLNREEKQEIRSTLISAIALGESSTERQNLRKQIAKDYNCSPVAVDGIRAQITKEVQSVLEKTALSGSISAAEFLSLVVNLSRLDSQGSVNESISSLSTDRNISPDTLRFALRSFHISPVVKTSPKSPKAPGSEPERKSSSAANGAHVDYDFERKRLWRAEWEKEVQKYVAGLSASEVSMLKVLCLPSKKPEPELSIYLRAGIRAENIFAVEGNKKAQVELMANLNSLGAELRGVQVIPEKLQDWLPETKELFDIVSLDYQGPISRDKFEIAHALPVSSKALVMINLLAAREDSRYSHELRAAFALESNDEAQLQEFYLRYRKRDAKAADELMHQEALKVALLDARDEVYEGVLIRSIGSRVKDKRAGPTIDLSEFEQYILEHEPEERIRTGALAVFACNLFKDLSGIAAGEGVTALRKTYTRVREIDRDQLTNDAANAVLSASINSPFITSLRRLEYRSQVSKKGSTFLTSIATLERPPQLHEQFRQFASFLQRVTEISLENLRLGSPFPRFEVFDKRGRALPRGARPLPLPTDQLVMVENGVPNFDYSIRADKYLRAATQYVSYEERLGKQSRCSAETVRREIIS